MQQLTTWDIPIGGIISTDGRLFKFIKIKRERKPRIGTVPVQYFVSQDSDKKKMCFIYGVNVELIGSVYFIKSEL